MFDKLFKRRNSGLDTGHISNTDFAIQASLTELIDLRLQAQQLKISSLMRTTNLMAGNHISRFKGRGMDYLESRTYQAGDDIRNMDWRVTARTGQPHVKLFEEERERPVLALIDLNPRMFFASKGRFKSVIASQAAALLAWAAISHGDRIGGLILNNSHVELSPKGGKSGILAFLHQLAAYSDPTNIFEQKGKASTSIPSSLHDELKRLSRMARPGSLVFILSDFYDFNDKSLIQLSRLKAKAECVLIRILDPIEVSPLPADRYIISNGKQQSVLNTANLKQATDYQQWFIDRQMLINKASQKLGILLIDLYTDESPVKALQKIFSKQNKSHLSS